MSEVENLLKHKIPFQLWRDSIHHYDNLIAKKLSYKTKPIKLYIEDKEDLYDKLKPILHYLVSDHMIEEHEGYYYNRSNFNIYVKTEDNYNYNRYGIEALFFTLSPVYNTRYGCVFMKTDYNDEDRLLCLNLIGIKIDMHFQYHKLEEETKIPTKISFKYDECVICLANLPNVLFNNCGHICICHNCDTESLNSCPMCRAVTTIKWRI